VLYFSINYKKANMTGIERSSRKTLGNEFGLSGQEHDDVRNGKDF
jgi:hypothetical protein